MNIQRHVDFRVIRIKQYLYPEFIAATGLRPSKAWSSIWGKAGQPHSFSRPMIWTAGRGSYIVMAPPFIDSMEPFYKDVDSLGWLYIIFGVELSVMQHHSRYLAIMSPQRDVELLNEVDSRWTCSRLFCEGG